MPSTSQMRTYVIDSSTKVIWGVRCNFAQVFHGVTLDLVTPHRLEVGALAVVCQYFNDRAHQRKRQKFNVKECHCCIGLVRSAKCYDSGYWRRRRALFER